MKFSLALAAFALVTGCVTFKDGGGASRALQSKSPSGVGTAIFTKEIGPQDSAVNFEVLDPKAGEKPVSVGFVGDAQWHGDLPHAAVWSKDGSVIAVQGADYKSWSHAYDFKRSLIVEDLYPPFQGNIDKLLKSRGGSGPKVLDDWTRFDQVAQPVADEGRSQR